MLSANTSITSWWILAMMALFLWYRNIKYDRSLSVFVLTLGIVQLIEYGIQNGADPDQSGRALFITLWLQCLVLAISVFIFINSSIKDKKEIPLTQTVVHNIAGWNLFFYAIVFIICLIFSFNKNLNFTNTRESVSGNTEISVNGGSILGIFSWIYVLGLFIPLLLIFGYYMWADIEMAILILYGIISTAYIMINHYKKTFSTIFCYLSVGFAFLSWFMGFLSLDKHLLKNI